MPSGSAATSAASNSGATNRSPTESAPSFGLITYSAASGSSPRSAARSTVATTGYFAALKSTRYCLPAMSPSPVSGLYTGMFRSRARAQNASYASW